MASLIERSHSVVQDHLGTAEMVIAATRAQVDGGTMRIATRTGAGVGLGLGAAVVAAGSRNGEDDLAAQFANGLVIAITESRILLLDVTAVGARPKGLVAHIDRQAVVRVVTGEKKVMLVKMTTISLAVVGDEVRELRFEIPKSYRRDAEAVVAALSVAPAVG